MLCQSNAGDVLTHEDSNEEEYKLGENHLERVRKELISKGRMLEIGVYQKLKDNDWISELSVPFWNSPTIRNVESIANPRFSLCNGRPSTIGSCSRVRS